MPYVKGKFRRRWRDPIVIIFVVIVVSVATLSGKSWLLGSKCAIDPEQERELILAAQSSYGRFEPSAGAASQRHLLAEESSKCNETSTDKECKPRQFPPPIFTEEQRANGAFVLHLIGMAYMFVALAIVCDEFFVPALSVITKKANISEDVAGATFMAAGGSAPELFTSIIGVFISFDDVGIGTIVGSAVFNILFVIGMCALFSRTDLYLTWWPLFRDVSFYSLALIVLIIFFRDNKIELYEAIVLLLVYILYVTFMKFNAGIERAVKKVLYKNKVTRVRSTDQLVPNFASRRASTPILHSGSKFRHGLLQLMIHTIDPMHDGKVDEKACQLHAIASLKVLLDATKTSNGSLPAAAQTTNNGIEGQENNSERFSQETKSTALDPIPEKYSAVDLQPSMDEVELEKEAQIEAPTPKVDGKPQQKVTINITEDSINTITPCNTSTGTESQPSVAKVEEVDDPLDLSWPTGFRKQVSYVLVAPIVILLWLTLPDTRRQEKEKWFPVTFIGSIIWIALFSYLMVWWATVVGDSIGIPSEVMGLTFLAAGTSIPDLITSVIVARKGFGDMAVSSSVGSNLFDITVGLPFPWILYNLVFYDEGGVPVKSKGMICSIVILFGMLMFVIVSIAAFKWKMNKGLGITMFVLYLAFVAVSLLFEIKVLTCRLRIP